MMEKKNSDFEKLAMLRSQVKRGNDSGNNVFERKTMMFSNATYEGFKNL